MTVHNAQDGKNNPEKGKDGNIMKKKVLALLLSTAMAVSVFAGCGGSGGGSSENASSGSETGSSEEQAPADNASEDAGADSGAAASNGEVVKLKALAILHPLTKDVQEMQYVTQIQEEAGVEIEWELIRADWDQVKATRFASGDIPDLLFNATTNADYQTYKGLLLELKP